MSIATDPYSKGKRLCFPDGTRISFKLKVPRPQKKLTRKEREEKERLGFFNVCPIHQLVSCWDSKSYDPGTTLKELTRAFERAWTNVPGYAKRKLADAWNSLPKKTTVNNRAGLELCFPCRFAPEIAAFRPGMWSRFSFTYPIQFWPERAEEQDAIFHRLWAYHLLLACGRYHGMGLTKQRRLHVLFLDGELDGQLATIIEHWNGPANLQPAPPVHLSGPGSGTA